MKTTHRCKHSIIFPDGSHIRQPNSKFIQPLSPFALRGASTYGKWQSPALRAALDYIHSNPSFIPGFVMKPSILNSGCDPGDALQDFMMLPKDPPFIVGVSCSVVAKSLAQFSEKTHVPIIAIGATSYALGKYTSWSQSKIYSHIDWQFICNQTITPGYMHIISK